DAPGDAAERERLAQPARLELARVEIFEGHEDGEREREQSRARERGGQLEEPEVDRDEVPVGREAEEEIVLGLRVDLREAIRAREHRGGQAERSGDELESTDEEGGNDHVVQVVDDVVEAAPID